MKRLLFIIPLILAVLVFGDFRTSGYRTGNSHSSSFTFDKNVTVDDTLRVDYIAPDDSTEVYVAGDLTVSGDVKPGIVRVNLFNNTVQIQSGTQNTLSSATWLNGMGAVSFDSLVTDSVFVLAYAAEDTNVVDSVHLFVWRSRTESTGTIDIVADGTDWGPSAVTYEIHTYTCSATIGAGSRFGFKFKPDAESAANKMIIYNIILYGHPK